MKEREGGGGHNTRFKCGDMKALAVYILALPRAYVAGLFLSLLCGLKGQGVCLEPTSNDKLKLTKSVYSTVA